MWLVHGETTGLVAGCLSSNQSYGWFMEGQPVLWLVYGAATSFVTGLWSSNQSHDWCMEQQPFSRLVYGAATSLTAGVWSSNQCQGWCMEHNQCQGWCMEQCPVLWLSTWWLVNDVGSQPVLRLVIRADCSMEEQPVLKLVS